MEPHVSGEGHGSWFHIHFLNEALASSPSGWGGLFPDKTQWVQAPLYLHKSDRKKGNRWAKPHVSSLD